MSTRIGLTLLKRRSLPCWDWNAFSFLLQMVNPTTPINIVIQSWFVRWNLMAEDKGFEFWVHGCKTERCNHVRSCGTQRWSQNSLRQLQSFQHWLPQAVPIKSSSCVECVWHCFFISFLNVINHWFCFKWEWIINEVQILIQRKCFWTQFCSIWITFHPMFGDQIGLWLAMNSSSSFCCFSAIEQLLNLKLMQNHIVSLLLDTEP